MFKRLTALLVCFTFSFSNLQYVHAQDFSVNQLPVPGTMVGESVPFAPLALKGLVVNLQKPLEFQFIVDTGKGPQDTSTIKDQANQLVKYFLAGLTIPEGDLWVNLSPYEKNRMVPAALGQTDLGRDLLAQDYILKQLTASLIYPEKDLGKEFWSRVYAKAQAQFGTTNVPVNTFNKVWILPDQAQVFENVNAAYVTKSTLKVMLDEDYLALKKHVVISNGTDSIGANVVRQIILPEIEKEVNTGKNFAPLRQIYQALILAKWYKETIQNGLLDALYTNKNKVAGVNLNDPAVKEQIYERYLKAYRKGAFNYIKEDPTPGGQVVPRKYFSGGISKLEPAMVATNGSAAMISVDGAMATFIADLSATSQPQEQKIQDAAMVRTGSASKVEIMTPQGSELNLRVYRNGPSTISVMVEGQSISYEKIYIAVDLLRSAFMHHQTIREIYSSRGPRKALLVKSDFRDHPLQDVMNIFLDALQGKQKKLLTLDGNDYTFSQDEGHLYLKLVNFRLQETEPLLLSASDRLGQWFDESEKKLFNAMSKLKSKDAAMIEETTPGNKIYRKESIDRVKEAFRQALATTNEAALEDFFWLPARVTYRLARDFERGELQEDGLRVYFMHKILHTMDLMSHARTPKNSEEEGIIKNAVDIVHGYADRHYLPSEDFSDDVNFIDANNGLGSGVGGEHDDLTKQIYIPSQITSEDQQRNLIHEAFHNQTVGFPYRFLNEGFTDYLTFKAIMESKKISAPDQLEPPRAGSGEELWFPSIKGPISRYIFDQMRKGNSTHINDYIVPIILIEQIQEYLKPGEFDRLLEVFYKGQWHQAVKILGGENNIVVLEILDSMWTESLQTGNVQKMLSFLMFAESILPAMFNKAMMVGKEGQPALEKTDAAMVDFSRVDLNTEEGRGQINFELQYFRQQLDRDQSSFDFVKTYLDALKKIQDKKRFPRDDFERLLDYFWYKKIECKTSDIWIGQFFVPRRVLNEAKERTDEMSGRTKRLLESRINDFWQEVLDYIRYYVRSGDLKSARSLMDPADKYRDEFGVLTPQFDELKLTLAAGRQSKPVKSKKVFNSWGEIGGVFLFDWRWKDGTRRYIFLGNEDENSFSSSSIVPEIPDEMLPEPFVYKDKGSQLRLNRRIKTSLRRLDFLNARAYFKGDDGRIHEDKLIELEQSAVKALEDIFFVESSSIHPKNLRLHYSAINGRILLTAPNQELRFLIEHVYDKLQVFMYDDLLYTLNYVPFDQDIYFGRSWLPTSQTQRFILKDGKVVIESSQDNMKFELFRQADDIFIQFEGEKAVKVDPERGYVISLPTLKDPPHGGAIRRLLIGVRVENKSYLDVVNESYYPVTLTYANPNAAMKAEGKQTKQNSAMIIIPSTIRDFYVIAEKIQNSPILELANFVVSSRQGIIEISNNYEQLLSELDDEINSQFLNAFKEKMEIFKNRIVGVPIKEGSAFLPGDEELAQQTISAYKNAITNFRETLEETSLFQGALASLRIPHDKLAELKVQRVLEGVSINRRNLYRLVEHFSLITTGNPWGIISPALDLNKLLNDAVKREENYIPYQMRAVRINFKLDERVPKIIGDKARLMTGFREVIRNAIYASVRHVERGIYTPLRDRSNILISTKYMPQENSIQVDIVDNGIGMDERKLRNMSLYGVSMSDYNQRVIFGGHGIGFTIMLSTILEHGGNVQVESDLQKGTTITTSLPEDTIHAQHIDRESIRVVRDNSQLSKANNGGIDLNQIDVKRNGKTVTVQFDPAQFSALEQGGFEGFTPVITGFQYIKSPFPLLGINITNQPERLAKI